jgi:hypothetical protein
MMAVKDAISVNEGSSDFPAPIALYQVVNLLPSRLSLHSHFAFAGTSNTAGFTPVSQCIVRFALWQHPHYPHHQQESPPPSAIAADDLLSLLAFVPGSLFVRRRNTPRNLPPSPRRPHFASQPSRKGTPTTPRHPQPTR